MQLFLSIKSLHLLTIQSETLNFKDSYIYITLNLHSKTNPFTPLTKTLTPNSTTHVNSITVHEPFQLAFHSTRPFPSTKTVRLVLPCLCLGVTWYVWGVGVKQRSARKLQFFETDTFLWPLVPVTWVRGVERWIAWITLNSMSSPGPSYTTTHPPTGKRSVQMLQMPLKITTRIYCTVLKCSNSEVCGLGWLWAGEESGVVSMYC